LAQDWLKIGQIFGLDTPIDLIAFTVLSSSAWYC